MRNELKESVYAPGAGETSVKIERTIFFFEVVCECLMGFEVKE